MTDMRPIFDLLQAALGEPLEGDTPMLRLLSDIKNSYGNIDKLPQSTKRATQFLIKCLNPRFEIDGIRTKSGALFSKQVVSIAKDIISINDDLVNNSPNHVKQRSYSSIGGQSAIFLFLADPQLLYENRLETMSDMNSIVNAISQLNWPTNNSFGNPMNLTCGGSNIGSIGSVIFGGDLCQTGGGYSFIDQVANDPTSYYGGYALQYIRQLFQNGYEIPFWSDNSGVNMLNVTPTFFGLGNHDIQSDYAPKVGWEKCGGFVSRPSDYWRYQMWNFIFQMHVGGGLTCDQSESPVFPVTAIDGSTDSTSWKDASFNYKVNLGPVDLYQVHRFGGDSEWGRDNGLGWLSSQLRSGGTSRPVIIVQHYSFDLKSSEGIKPNWSPEEKNEFLNFLEPFNVIGLFVGHNHDVPSSIPYQASSGADFTFNEFRPGSYGVHGAFALVRVTRTTLDVAQGSYSGGALSWVCGFGQDLDWTISESDNYISLSTTAMDGGWSMIIQTCATSGSNAIVPLTISQNNQCNLGDEVEPSIGTGSNTWTFSASDVYTLINPQSCAENGPVLLINNTSSNPNTIGIIYRTSSSSGFQVSWINNGYLPSAPNVEQWWLSQNDVYYVLDDYNTCGDGPCVFIHDSSNQWVALLAPITSGSLDGLQTVWLVNGQFPSAPGIGTWVTHSYDQYYVIDNLNTCGDGPCMLVHNGQSSWIGLVAPGASNSLQISWILNGWITDANGNNSWDVEANDLYYPLCSMSAAGLGPSIFAQNTSNYNVALIGASSTAASTGLQTIWTASNSYPAAAGVTAWAIGGSDRYYVLSNINGSGNVPCLMVQNTTSNWIALLAFVDTDTTTELQTVWCTFGFIPAATVNGDTWTLSPGDQYQVLNFSLTGEQDSVCLFVKNNSTNSPAIALITCNGSSLITEWVMSGTLQV